jgi:hypothetical protein
MLIILPRLPADATHALVHYDNAAFLTTYPIFSISKSGNSTWNCRLF